MNTMGTVVVFLLFAALTNVCALSQREIIDLFRDPLVHTLSDPTGLLASIAEAKTQPLESTTDVVFELPDGTPVEYEIRHTKLPSLESYSLTSALFLFEGYSKNGTGLLKGEVIRLHGSYSTETGLGVSFQSTMRGSLYVDLLWPEDESFMNGEVKYKSYNRAYSLRIEGSAQDQRRLVQEFTEETNQNFGTGEIDEHLDDTELLGSRNTELLGTEKLDAQFHGRQTSDTETCGAEHKTNGRYVLFNSKLECSSEYNTPECSYSLGSCCGLFTQGCTDGSLECGCVDTQYRNIELKKYRVLIGSTPAIVTSIGDNTEAYLRMVEGIHRINLVLVKELNVVLEVVEESELYTGSVVAGTTQPISQTPSAVAALEIYLGLGKSHTTYDLSIGVWQSNNQALKDSEIGFYNLAMACSNTTVTLNDIEYTGVRRVLPVSFNANNGGRTFQRNLILGVSYALGIGLPTLGCDYDYSIHDKVNQEFPELLHGNRNGMSEKGTGFSAMAMPSDYCKNQPQPSVLYDTVYNPRALETIQRSKNNPFFGGTCGTVLDTTTRLKGTSPSLSYDDTDDDMTCRVPTKTPFRLLAVNAAIEPKTISYSWELVAIDFLTRVEGAPYVGWYPHDKQGPLLFPIREPSVIPERVFPRMDAILDGDLYSNPAEQLATKSVSLNFTLVTRKQIDTISSPSTIRTLNSLSNTVLVQFVETLHPLTVNQLNVPSDMKSVQISWYGGFVEGASTVRVLAAIVRQGESFKYEGFTRNLGEYHAASTQVELPLSSESELCGETENYVMRIMVESSRDEENNFNDGCTHFALSPNAISLPKCGVTIDTSPSANILIGNGTSSTWSFQSDNANLVQLSFDYFSVEEAFDFVKVYDGSDESAPLLRSFTGNKVPFPVFSTGKNMHVVFENDGLGNVVSLFRARFSEVNSTSLPILIPSTSNPTDDPTNAETTEGPTATAEPTSDSTTTTALIVVGSIVGVLGVSWFAWRTYGTNIGSNPDLIVSSSTVKSTPEYEAAAEKA